MQSFKNRFERINFIKNRAKQVKIRKEPNIINSANQQISKIKEKSVHTFNNSPKYKWPINLQLKNANWLNGLRIKIQLLAVCKKLTSQANTGEREKLKVNGWEMTF